MSRSHDKEFDDLRAKLCDDSRPISHAECLRVATLWGRVRASEAAKDKTIESLTAENERLRKLAYIGDHHFSDLTWKARCEEEVETRKTLAAENERLRERVARLEADLSQAQRDIAGAYLGGPPSSDAQARSLLADIRAQDDQHGLDLSSDLRDRLQAYEPSDVRWTVVGSFYPRLVRVIPPPTETPRCSDGCGASKDEHCWNKSTWADTAETIKIHRKESCSDSESLAGCPVCWPVGS